MAAETLPAHPECRTCRFADWVYRQSWSRSDLKKSVCHAGLPVATRVIAHDSRNYEYDAGGTLWPIVMPHEWCAHHKPPILEESS